MMRAIYILVLLLSLFQSNTSHANVEDALPYTAAKDMVFDLPPKEEISPEIVEEAANIGLKCVSGHSKYENRDCECYTKAFVQERLKDDQVDFAWVENKLIYVCYDEEKILNYYQDDQNCRSPFRKEDVLTTEFCACYAEKALLIFRNMTGLSVTGLMNRIKKAHKVCTNKFVTNIPDYSLGNSIRIPRR